MTPLTINMAAIEKLQREDHDTITRLEAKVDNLLIEIKMVNDGYKERLTNHEMRIKHLEDIAIATDVPNSYKDFILLKQTVHDFQTTAIVWRTIAGILGGGTFFLLTQTPQLLHYWGILH